jgi:glycosyltransferase involved in cell wall biosynthesis
MLNDEPLVDILMATYNGASALPAQLASLVAQTHKNWRLIVRDDGSTDNTLAVLYEFSRQNPGKVLLINDALGNLGALRNFATYWFILTQNILDFLIMMTSGILKN